MFDLGWVGHSLNMVNHHPPPPLVEIFFSPQNTHSKVLGFHIPAPWASVWSDVTELLHVVVSCSTAEFNCALFQKEIQHYGLNLIRNQEILAFTRENLVQE